MHFKVRCLLDGGVCFDECEIYLFFIFSWLIANEITVYNKNSYIYTYVSQYFYLQILKDFISNKKHTVKTNTYQSQSLLSSITLFNNRLFIFCTLI